MPIPPFNAAGNLSIGDLFGAGRNQSIIPATVDEIHERFVLGPGDFGQPGRSAIFEGWTRHRTAVAELGLQYQTFVNGSFITIEPSPGDIDICLLLDGDEVNRLNEAAKQRLSYLVSGPGCKPEFYCDAYGVSVFPAGDPRFVGTAYWISYWTRVFGHARRTGESKAFLIVST